MCQRNKLPIFFVLFSLILFLGHLNLNQIQKGLEEKLSLGNKQKYGVEQCNSFTLDAIDTASGVSVGSVPHHTNPRQLDPAETHALNLLNPADELLYPVYTDGCCGIGHRLSRVVPTLVYANKQHRTARVCWTDISWSSLFNDTQYAQGTRACGRTELSNIALQKGLLFNNGFPDVHEWSGPKNPNGQNRTQIRTATVLDFYRHMEHFLDNEHMFGIYLSMRESLSPLVLSHLDSIRTGLGGTPEESDAESKEADHNNNNSSSSTLRRRHVSICAHVRQGNGETGDWARKSRQIQSTPSLLNGTLSAMRDFAHSENATSISVFVASDSEDIITWFRNNISRQNYQMKMNISMSMQEMVQMQSWKMVQSQKVLPKPESGVWFGEHGSNTSAVLNQTMKNEAMAEAVAEVFALGECDALMIPTYSSFTYPAIVLTAGRKKHLFFRKTGSSDDYNMTEIRQYST